MGKAKNLKNRVSSYFTKGINTEQKTAQLISRIEKIRIIKTQSELESLLLEAHYIKKFLPEYNVKLIDKKAYPLIRITIKDNAPKILTSRNEDDRNSLYFGPYPNPGAMRLVLRTIRRIFPFQSVINHSSKICFYNHLGLCPCPEVTGEITTYKKNIRYIIQFLKGDINKIIKNLEKERDGFSKNEDYENAKSIQKKIDAVKVVTSPIHRPFEYELNPNLSYDLRKIELGSLFNELQKMELAVKKLDRIECFDVSNISGKFSTGSMVVFTLGEKDTSSYRRFRIRIDGHPNDFAMMKEILIRRLKRDDWEFPDLIVVDGGKNQVSAALEAMETVKKKIPLIGLAKRLETIVTPEFSEITLARNGNALKLLMRIRDESHRFAITYHRKLRSKSIQI
ncbi:MAG: hypothetical protein M1268_03005 [Patescibacteria group bacterium]|nr:hypothetical protein [Patescibacteria group bacterium]